MSVLVFIIAGAIAIVMLLFFAAWINPKPPLDPED